MQFHAPLISGTLIKRYKRFMADVRLDDGTEVTAHVANSGAMTGLKDPDLKVWLSPANNPKRKLAWTWELAEVDGKLVGINTSHPNAIAAEAITAGQIPELSGYAELKREVKYGKNSRIDIQLTSPDKPRCLVEIKNVHLKRKDVETGGLAEFPDAVTERGTKHLMELGDAAEAGDRAVMLYIVQRMDCESFNLAKDIDPTYAEAFKVARERGVEVLCYVCDITIDGIRLDRPLPMAV